MSEDQNHVVTLKVRVSPEFREKIVNTAKENNRSMNAEIVKRLEDSFEEFQDEEVEHHFMVEIFKDQERKIDELLKLVQSLKKNP